MKSLSPLKLAVLAAAALVAAVAYKCMQSVKNAVSTFAKPANALDELPGTAVMKQNPGLDRANANLEMACLAAAEWQKAKADKQHQFGFGFAMLALKAQVTLRRLHPRMAAAGSSLA